MRKRYYGLVEVGLLLGVGYNWVGELVRRGEIPAQRIGRGRWRVRPSDLEAYARREQVDLDHEALAAHERAQLEKRLARREADGVGPNAHGLTMNAS